MITTTYKCDKCGAEKNTSDQFWTLGLTLACGRYSGSPSQIKSMNVCRPCLESFGIHAPEPKENEPAPAYPTLEDLIREIVRQEAR